MQTFLVAFTYNSVFDAVLENTQDEPVVPQINWVHVTASDENEALAWAEDVAIRFTDYVNDGDGPAWREAGNHCRIERDPQGAGLTPDLRYFQTVRVGETPIFERMTRQGYLDWLERDGEFDDEPRAS